MPALNSISDILPTPRRIIKEVFQYAAIELPTVFFEIMIGKRTGSLTINFSNGTPSGYIEWQQKSLSSTPPLDIPSFSPVDSTVASEQRQPTD